MRDPNYQHAERKEVRPAGAEAADQDVTRDPKAFTAAIRNRIFVFLRGLVIGDYEAALATLEVAPVSKPAVSPTSKSAGLDQSGRPSPTESAAGLETHETADLEVCATGETWTADRLHAAVEAFYVGHERICLEPEARNARHTYVLPSEDKKTWRVQQRLVDPEGDNDWVAEFEVNLAQSRVLGEPRLQLRRIGSLV
jgi:hypothetical protein